MKGELPSDGRRPRMKPYDLVREALIALGVVGALVVALAALFSSPDAPPMTIQEYASAAPLAFLQTALGAIDGSGAVASYGPPYNHATGSVQRLGLVSFQSLAGVTIPVDAARDFVLAPLATMARVDPGVRTALRRFDAAPPRQRGAWEKAYGAALDAAVKAHATSFQPPAAAGAVGPMLAGLLRMAQVGGLDGLLLASHRFYVTDYTRPLLFLSENALPTRAAGLHLLGSQWGMMNETGNYPGAVWLWLYTLWYQVRPFSTSPNGDVLIMTIMAILTAAFVLTPWLPGVNRLPRVLRVYRAIWRDWYRR